MNNKISEIKKLYIETGRLNQNIISKEIAISWYKCKLQNMYPADLIKTSNNNSVKHFEEQFEKFVDAIVSEKFQFLLCNGSMQVSSKRIRDFSLDSIDSIDDLLIGTNGGYNAIKSSNIETVSLDEHYLDVFCKYYSVGIPINKDNKLIGCLMILSEIAPSAYDLSLITTKLNEYMQKGLGVSQNSFDAHETKFNISSVSINLAYPVDEEEKYKLQIEKGLRSPLPLVLCGESGSGKTYHIRLLSLLSENHSYIDLKSLPRNIQKQCLEEALSQNRTLYIDDLHLAGDDFIQLLIVYTDNKINKLYNENASKMNCSKVVLSTVNNSENKYYIALMERLKFNIVHIVNLNEIYENQEEVITKFFKINSVKHDELTKKYLLEKMSKWSFKDLKSFIINKSVVNDNVLLLSFDSVIDRVDELLSIDDNEKKHITKILEIMDYNILAAAKVLKISRSTLYRKIEKYNIHMSYIETHQANKYKNSKS